jgi:hypothetical protein
MKLAIEKLNMTQSMTVIAKQKIIEKDNLCVIPLCFVGKNLNRT